MNNKVKIYALSLAVFFVVLLVLASKADEFVLYGFLVFLCLIALSENLSIKLPDSTTLSSSFAVILACMIIFGPLTASLASLVTAVTIYDIKRRNSIFKWIFNGAQFGLAAYLAGHAYLLLGGKIFYTTNGLLISDFPLMLIPLIASVVVYFICNMIFVSICLGLINNDSIIKRFKLEINDLSLNYLAALPVSLALAEVFIKVGVSGIVLIVIPFMVIRLTFLSYIQSHENASSIIKTLISAIEAKDKYTWQHSERVASYANVIATTMSMSEKEMVQLNYAAYLHDIGKMAVQRRVLNKPHKLTDLEFRMMKRHPAVGHKIVSQIDMLKHVSEPILKHHEFINGKGYPLGTTDLPLSARIIAVADAFDAMTSLRPYRQPLSIDQAFNELQKSAGTQFDPMIVQYLKKGLAHESQDQIKHDKPSINQAQLQLDLAV